MTTKADFTESEWETLGRAVTGAGMLVALSDRGFFDTFKEANALAKHLGEAHAHSDNELVREIAATHSRPFGFTSSPTEVEQGTVEALHGAVTLLQEKAPDDLAAYRELVLEVAQSVAEAAKGVAPGEATALDTIRAALAEPEQPR
jgi:hypothetical protein